MIAAHAAIACGLAFVSFAQSLWVNTSTPDLAEAKELAKAIYPKFSGKMCAYAYMQEFIC